MLSRHDDGNQYPNDAIAHRNYSIEGRGIEITIFDDRMEVLSPGMLLSTISIEDIRALKGAHESRNPLVARVLREVGLVQEMGEGMRRIYAVMKSNALAQPEIGSDRSGFTVVLHNRSLYEPEVKLWLSNYDRFDLDENQRAVVALGYAGKEFSTQDIIDRLGIVDTDKVRELVGGLRTHGILEPTKNKLQVERYKQRNHVPRRSVPKYRIYHIDKVSAVTGSVPGGVDDDFRDQSFDLYLSGLPYDTPVSAVTDFLAELGCDVLDVRIPPGIGANGRGFAFASVVSKESSELTIARLDGHLVMGRRIHVRAAHPRGSRA